MRMPLQIINASSGKLIQWNQRMASGCFLARRMLVRCRCVCHGFTMRRSNQRDWSPDQAILPTAKIHGPLVTIRNIRNFRYEATDRYTPGYYDKTFDLRELDSAWFFVEPFGRSGAAHTFVSFGFRDRDFVALSVEIRKEKGESFSPVKGLLRRYEIMYVIGDERDLVKLRTNYRNDPVHLYRIRTTPERMRAMFL